MAVEVEDGPADGRAQSTGCLLLTEAYAEAVKQCGQGLFTVLDGIDATSARTLQTCGLIDGPLPASYGGASGRRRR